MRHTAELTVAAVIILLVMLLAAPMVLSQRDQARQRQQEDQLRQLGQALHNYHGTFERFPSSPGRKPAPQQSERPAELISPL